MHCNLRQTPCECPFFGKNLRQIGELWTHSSELDSKRKPPSVSRNFLEHTSNHIAKQWQQCSIFFYTAKCVENIVFDKEELYLVIQIENNSTLDYDLNFLNLSIETRQKGKSKFLQSLYQEVIYKHNLPSKIAEGKMTRFVYVLPKFSLSNDRRAVLELNEKGGERNIELENITSIY